MLYGRQAASEFPAKRIQLSTAFDCTVIRKSILVTALLLLAAVQALAADCDLRCSLMAVSSGSHGCGHEQTSQGQEQAMHCHGMSMDADHPCNSAMSGSGCPGTVCRARLDAIDKKLSADESTSKSVSATGPAILIHSADEGTRREFSAHRSLDRRNASSPLDLRPGSSLRI